MTSKKVIFLVEGQTEESFVNRVLAPDLRLTCVPVLLTTKTVKSGPDFKGGIQSYSRVKKEILRLLADSSVAAVTTMFDYYGLPASFPGRDHAPPASGRDRALQIEAWLAADIGHERFLPYIQVHEFEALLFSQPAALASAFPSKKALAGVLQKHRQAFATPEDINDDPTTCPHRRIKDHAPEYRKATTGPIVAERIGLADLRKECRHFDEWLTKLQALGG